jgi:hypothetical protein
MCVPSCAHFQHERCEGEVVYIFMEWLPISVDSDYFKQIRISIMAVRVTLRSLTFGRTKQFRN